MQTATKHQPIRVGDRFFRLGGTLEVTRTLPGGRVELQNPKRSRLHHRYTHQMRDWVRSECLEAESA